jgi:hypothetical protein
VRYDHTFHADCSPWTPEEACAMSSPDGVPVK